MGVGVDVVAVSEPVERAVRVLVVGVEEALHVRTVHTLAYSTSNRATL